MEATKLPFDARRPVVRYLRLPREARHLIDQFLLQTHPAAALMSAVTFIESGPHIDIPAGNTKFIVNLPYSRCRLMNFPPLPLPNGPRHDNLSRQRRSYWMRSREYGNGENYFTRQIQQRREEFIARMYLEDAAADNQSMQPF